MSALGLASVGVQCEDKALGMASLGLFCGAAVIQEPEEHGSWSKRKREEVLHHKRLVREDEELIAVVIAAISNGVIK